MADKQNPDKALYKQPAVRSPSLHELMKISDDLGLHCTEDDMGHFKEHIDKSLSGAYQRVDELVAPTLPVRYPRTPGYKPEPEYNKGNAWYWKCDIAGAPEGLLKGRTVGIKDNTCVAGVPMLNGSKIMEEYVPDIDATVVTRILDAGGRITGKTNCEHLCFSGSSFTNDTGPTLNPHDKGRSAGGSSGGSSAAVANGDVDMALGGDQGGSIRIPSSWCGTVGHKPTFGLVPYTGAVPIEITVDHVGPITKTVTDCALMLQAIAGRDGMDSRQPVNLTVPEYSKLLTGDLKGMKIGLVTEGFSGCDEDVQKCVKEAAQSMSKAGAIVEDVSIPLHEDGLAIWTPVCVEGAYKCMVQGAGAGHHYKGFYSTSIIDKLRSGYAQKSGNLSDPMKATCLLGEYINRNYGNKYYAKGQNLTMRLQAAYDKALDTYDVIIMPTLPYKAPLLPPPDANITDRLHNALTMIKNTAPFDSTGHPSLTINAGMSDGLPVGMMITGKHFKDEVVLNVAYAFEKIRDASK